MNFQEKWFYVKRCLMKSLRYGKPLPFLRKKDNKSKRLGPSDELLEKHEVHPIILGHSSTTNDPLN
jgi:hypothetical protein